MRLKVIATQFALASCGMLLASCASPPPPELAVANAAVQDAERAGAVTYAPLEINRARDELARANDAVKQDRPKQAQRLASEANADAKLAAVKAQAAQAEQAASGTGAPPAPSSPPLTLSPSMSTK